MGTLDISDYIQKAVQSLSFQNPKFNNQFGTFTYLNSPVPTNVLANSPIQAGVNQIKNMVPKGIDDIKNTVSMLANLQKNQTQAQPINQAVQTLASPVSTVTPTPTPDKLAQLTSQIADGFKKYGRPEMADYANFFAQAGVNLPDPLLPATLALKETSGGKNLSHKNNILNIGPEIDYPSIQSNIIGGEGKKGFMGVMNSGLYNKYLQSGDLQDFFQTYTPTNDQQGNKVNGSYQDQIKQYNQLRQYFQNN